MHENDKLLAYLGGWDAYWKGIVQEENPYTDPEFRDEWFVGWLTAQDSEKNQL